MDPNNLYIDNWFKLPPKGKGIKNKERKHGKKSRKGPPKKTSKKRG